MTRRIPMTETLELILTLEPDSVDELRLAHADRAEMFQHMRNAFEMYAMTLPGVDAQKLAGTLQRAWLRGPAADGWEELGEPEVIGP